MKQIPFYVGGIILVLLGIMFSFAKNYSGLNYLFLGAGIMLIIIDLFLRNNFAIQKKSEAKSNE